MTYRPPVTRTHGTRLTEEEIGILYVGWRANETKPSLSALLNCTERNVQAWFRRFREGFQPSAPPPRAASDSSFFGPVPKRPVPAPNAMPWATPARLMARRA